MRKRYIQIDGELIEVFDTFEQPKSAAIHGDIPDYRSPIDGRVISGKVKRRDDLRRNGCRPWEGSEQEKKEAAKRLRADEQVREDKLDKAAWETWYSLHPDKRKKLMY